MHGGQLAESKFLFNFTGKSKVTDDIYFPLEEGLYTLLRNIVIEAIEKNEFPLQNRLKIKPIFDLIFDC